jgi:peptidoglycan/xylan/chitin deacetylase (PgdA/CDA1 family)
MNFFKRNTGLLLRFDDIAPNMNWEIMDKCEKLFLDYNIKPILGIIPNNEDEELLAFPEKKNFWEKVKQWQSFGWEISIHGYNHRYSSVTKKKDYFNYGGRSEFFGYSLEDQTLKLKKSIEIFKEQNVNVRSFFAPNHTYDLNTFKALKANGIYKVIDGYGLFPYNKFGINFMPQLFFKNILLPFGIQSTQIHLNNWDAEKYDDFKTFVVKNHKKIINYDFALSKTNNSFINFIIRLLSEYLLKFYRFLRIKF